jgi:hypothetical protein
MTQLQKKIIKETVSILAVLSLEIIHKCFAVTIVKWLYS